MEWASDDGTPKVWRAAMTWHNNRGQVTYWNGTKPPVTRSFRSKAWLLISSLNASEPRLFWNPYRGLRRYVVFPEPEISKIWNGTLVDGLEQDGDSARGSILEASANSISPRRSLFTW